MKPKNTYDLDLVLVELIVSLSGGYARKRNTLTENLLE